MKPLLIEVGSFDGKDSFSYHERGFEVFTFEPKKDLYANLVLKSRCLPDYTVINSAVSAFDGVTRLNICTAGGASSILEFKPTETLVDHWGEDRTDIHYSGESYDVTSTRLDTFIKLFHLEDREIEFLHIDAQGVDLDVLESLGEFYTHVKAGVVETVINPDKSIYVSQKNTLESLRNYFESHGFKVDDVVCNDPTNCEYNVHFTRVD